MMNIVGRLVLSIAVVVLPSALAAQTKTTRKPKPKPPFCENDPRPAVSAYCGDLAKFQNAVNLPATDNKKVTTEGQAISYLVQLDLSQPGASNYFITAVHSSLAVQAAMKSTAIASSALLGAGQARLDRQQSAPSSANGTTSLVSKTGSAELLSLALNSGALTQSVNGTTTTLTTNADQLFRLITGSDPDCTVTCVSRGWFEDKVLNYTNISATLNLAQPSSKNVATSGQASGSTSTPVSSAALPTSVGTLSGITAKYELLNKFDPRSDKFKENWQAAIGKGSLATAAKSLGDATDAVKDILAATHPPSISQDENGKPYTQDGKTALQVAQGDPTGKALATFFDKYFNDAAAKALQDPKIANDVALVMQQRAIYRQAWFDALHEAVGNLLTIEYDYNHPTNQPTTSVMKLIYAYNFKTAGMITFNGAVSLYNGALPAGAKYGQLYYGQISTQYDRTITGQNKGLQTQLSLAGYWQYQPHASVLNIAAGTVAPGTDIPLPNGTQEFVGTAGSLWVTQAKLTIKGAGGVNVPIGVSWSNKTDLLQGNKIGGQVGLSYNFSSVAGLFTGGSQ